MSATFARLRLRASTRIGIRHEGWYSNRLKGDDRLRQLAGDPRGVGIQDLEAEGVGGRLYVLLYRDDDAAAQVLARLRALEADGATPTLRCAGARTCVIVCEAEEVHLFYSAVAIRIANRLREASYGGPVMEEDPVEAGALPVLFPTVDLDRPLPLLEI